MDRYIVHYYPLSICPAICRAAARRLARRRRVASFVLFMVVMAVTLVFSVFSLLPLINLLRLFSSFQELFCEEIFYVLCSSYVDSIFLLFFCGAAPVVASSLPPHLLNSFAIIF